MNKHLDQYIPILTQFLLQPSPVQDQQTNANTHNQDYNKVHRDGRQDLNGHDGKLRIALHVGLHRYGISSSKGQEQQWI